MGKKHVFNLALKERKEKVTVRERWPSRTAGSGWQTSLFTNCELRRMRKESVISKETCRTIEATNKKKDHRAASLFCVLLFESEGERLPAITHATWAPNYAWVRRLTLEIRSFVFFRAIFLVLLISEVQQLTYRSFFFPHDSSIFLSHIECQCAFFTGAKSTYVTDGLGIYPKAMGGVMCLHRSCRLSWMCRWRFPPPFSKLAARLPKPKIQDG